MHADEIRVKEEWFVPHFLPRKDSPLEMAMVREWKEYMSYEDFHNGGIWCSRFAAYILASIPGGQNMRTARVATTFALWCVTPNGRGFLDPLLRKIREEKAESLHRDLAIAAWAVENQLERCVANRLTSLLREPLGGFVYKHKPYPTLPDNRAAELTLVFLSATKQGRALLSRVNQSTSERNWLPL